VKNVTLSPAQAARVMEEFASVGVFRCVVTGGEPLLSFAKESTFEAIKVAKQRGMICHLNSNLTMLSEDDAARLKELGVDSVLASLISYNEQTHDWLACRQGAQRQTVRGISYLSAAGVRVGVSMVLTRYNQDDVMPTAELAKAAGARGFYVTKVSCPISCTNFDEFRVNPEVVKRSLDELLEVEQKLGLTVDILEAYPHCFLGDLKRYARFARRRCGGGIATCVVGADGNVRACTHDDHVYGNLFEEGLVTPWKRMTDWRDGSNLPSFCLSCKHFAGCGGGCRIEARTLGRDGVDPYATDPEDVSVATEREDLSFLEEFATKTVRVNSCVVIRDEEFGGIAAAGAVSSTVAFLNQDAVNMLCSLKEEGPVPVELILARFEKDRLKMLAFLYGLYIRDIIVEVP